MMSMKPRLALGSILPCDRDDEGSLWRYATYKGTGVGEVGHECLVAPRLPHSVGFEDDQELSSLQTQLRRTTLHDVSAYFPIA